MELRIELVDKDYQYCLDYVSGKTNMMALNNTNRIIKAVTDGTRYENRLTADMVGMLKELKSEFEQYEPKWAENEDQVIASNRTWEDFDDIIQQKIDALKGEDESDEKSSRANNLSSNDTNRM